MLLFVLLLLLLLLLLNMTRLRHRLLSAVAEIDFFSEVPLY